MACCNRRRARQATPSAGPAAGVRLPAGPPAQPPDPAEVPVRYVGRGRVRVEGAVSGRIYRASPASRLLAAKPEDVRSLLRSGLFTRA